MSKTYRTKDLPGFENLLVIGNVQNLDDGHGVYSLVEVEQFVNTGVLVGDRELKVNPEKGSIWINIHHLDEVDPMDAQREFANDNPFGKFMYEGRYEKDELVIAYGKYEKAVSITIYEMPQATKEHSSSQAQKTLYSGAFFATRDQAMEIIYDLLNGHTDPDDLIFELKQLKEDDFHG